MQAVDGSLQMNFLIIKQIPTSNIAQLHPHLKDIGSEFSPLDDQVQIQLLIVKYLPEAPHVLDQVTGPPGTPSAQKMMLGWVIIDEVCLGNITQQNM